MKKFYWLFGGTIILLGMGCQFLLGAKIDAHSYTSANGSKEYMIILGAKVKKDGEPSQSLRKRLEAALPYLQQHEHVKVIVSGGKGADEPQSEASVMLAYLKENGIERNRILVEDRSTSTFENLQYSMSFLPSSVNELTIVSNDFHLARAQYLASKLQLHTDTIAAPTPSSVKVKSHLRERLALMKAYITGN